MDENKNEILEETAENVFEEVVETADLEYAVSEESVEEAEEDSSEAEKYVSIESLIDEIKALKLKNRILSVILAVIIAGAVIFAGVRAYMNYNPYNHMGFPNISGMTIGDMAKNYGITVEQIIEEYGLPEDVKENTYYDVIQYLMPTSKVVEMYGMDFETAKTTFMFPDEITEDTLWADAEATIPLSVYIGTGDTLTEFIEEYNLPETVTETTLWGEVRKIYLNAVYDMQNAPAEEEDVVEEVVEEQPQDEETMSAEEIAEIMAYLENASETAE